MSSEFEQFQFLCDKILAEASHNGKTKLIKDFVEGGAWQGDLFTLCKLLLAKEDQRVFHLREKSLVKLLSSLWNAPLNDMLVDLQKGDIAATVASFFEQYGKPQMKSVLNLKQVDKWLDKLSTLTKEDEQSPHLASILSVATSRDINLVCKLIDKDLKINIGAKFVLNALHPQAFDAYRNTHNLKSVIDKVISHQLDTNPGGSSKKTGSLKSGASGSDDDESAPPKLKKSLSIGLSLGTPIKPMLAKACQSFDEAWKRCPSGMYVEIKYDGERVQVHKNGNQYLFFSRNLKPVKPNKIEGLEELLAVATKAQNFIIDGEVLVVDKVTMKMLPFGALGVHKQKQFPNAQLCYFIFDIMMLNGENLLQTPYENRRQILINQFQLVTGKLALSDAKEVKSDDDLQGIWKRVLAEALEGLMLKDRLDTYKPNQRHWLKLKKDYLAGMADSADCLILGAYYGSGNKGGLITTYLCCVFDQDTQTFKTTCKASGGLDDATLQQLLKTVPTWMKRINGDHTQIPPWLSVAKMYTPDWVAIDPKTAPVWEINGTSFSISSHHTADGISIRFPRIKGFRDDKDWTTATTLKELEDLAASSPDFIAARELKGNPSVKVPKKAKAAGNAGASAGLSLFSSGDTSTLNSGKKLGLSGITYIVGDITTQMLGDANSNRLILVATDGSKWPTGDEFILNKWPSASKAFSKNKDRMEPGSAILVKTPIGTEDQGICRLAIMVCINPHTQNFMTDALSNALDELCTFCTSNAIKSAHFCWPRDLKAATWNQIEIKLTSRLVQPAKLQTFVYSTEPITGVVWKPKSKKKGLIVHDSDDDEGSEGDDEDEDEDEDDEDDNETSSSTGFTASSSASSSSSNPVKITSDGSIPAPFSTDSDDALSAKSVLLYRCSKDLQSQLIAYVLSEGGHCKTFELKASIKAKEFTHVVTEGDWDSTISNLLAANSNIKVVKPTWVFDSVQKGKAVYEKPHFVPKFH